MEFFVVANAKLQIFGDLPKGLSPFLSAQFNFLSDTNRFLSDTNRFLSDTNRFLSDTNRFLSDSNNSLCVNLSATRTLAINLPNNSYAWYNNPNHSMERRCNNMEYSKEELDTIFAKGSIIPGKDPDKYRKDSCGNEIYRDNYGLETPMGWEVDHSLPKAKGGTNNPRNLKPLQSSENASKGDTYPYKKKK